MYSYRPLLYRTLALLLALLLLSACNGIGGEPTVQVWLDQPLAGSEFATGEVVKILAHARDAGGPGIAEVQIYIDGNLSEQIPTDSSLPLVSAESATWQFDRPGTYTIEVRAKTTYGVLSSAASAQIVIKGEAVAQVPTRTPTRRATTPTPTPTRRVTPTPTPTPTRRVITPTRTSPPSASTKPIINSVSGPASIFNNGQRNYFNVNFSDGDGNINRVTVRSPNGVWDNLDYDPRTNITSGNTYNGIFTFNYFCATGSSPASDTLSIVLYDSSGNASSAYPFTLACASSSGAETSGNTSSGSRDITGTFTSSSTQLNAPGPSVAFNWNTLANGKFKYSLVLEIRPVTGQYSEKQLANSVEQHNGVTAEFPSTTTNYTLRAYFNDANEKPTSKAIGSITVNVGVTQSAPQAGATPFITFFTADSTSLQAGQCTTLRWDSGNITSIFLNGEGVTGKENRQVCPTQTTVYTLLANAPSGGLQKQLTITVTGSQPSLSFPAQKNGSYLSISITGGHGSTHHVGESVQVCFTVTNSNSALHLIMNDYHPTSSDGSGNPTGSPTTMFDGNYANGTYCFPATINGPEGYEALVLRTAPNPECEGPCGDRANIWIYVAP